MPSYRDLRLRVESLPVGGSIYWGPDVWTAYYRAQEFARKERKRLNIALQAVRQNGQIFLKRWSNKMLGKSKKRQWVKGEWSR